VEARSALPGRPRRRGGGTVAPPLGGRGSASVVARPGGYAARKSLPASVPFERCSKAEHNTDRSLPGTHGWPYGYTALLRAEILHGHPNGLDRICGVPGGAIPQSVLTRAHWGSGTLGRVPARALDVQPHNSPLKNQLNIPGDARTTVTTASTNSAFDWTAAAIGATVASLFVVLLAAGIILRTRRVSHLAR
jgi:hypothetical protein